MKIQAPASKVWDVLWKDETYRKWTSVFSGGSHAISDWKEGSKVLFLGFDGGGMYSVIDRLVPDQEMTFRHLGVVKGGVEQPLDEETKKWSGALERYRLSGQDGQTTLYVEMDITEDFEQYFNDVFPRALESVKEISES